MSKIAYVEPEMMVLKLEKDILTVSDVKPLPGDNHGETDPSDWD